MEMRAPRIIDVARIAGVSTATVSRALSKPETVAETTRISVLAAAEQTGYRVNHAARNLRRQRTGAIVVLVPNLGNPFFSEILAGIEVMLSRADLNMLVVDTGQAHAKPDLMSEYLHNTRADGIIALDGWLPDSVLASVRDSNASPPIVFACEWTADPSFASVRADNEGGARLAIAHLKALGHSKIGILSGPPDNVLTMARGTGARDAMLGGGIPVRDDFMFDGDFTLDSGVMAAHAWLDLPDRPTAVFCASDQMAFGFISELARSGISVPRSVSVVGFDDIDIAGRYIPALTTVRQPRAGLGTSAARMLLDRLAAPEGGLPTEHLMLDVELIVRDSTGAAPSG
ncbi:LacI family transcriptional regulator [Hoeflea marina]|uniref:LacI family transcriptional regulator n=1 Tax=Hoeflea marina TaxID=274592 RepID=A0A317PIZ6_9HYPH|nr:LacI family DNA-binding transcriptional regulator [Hoeflea marina]PWW00432.1 LacI family transcriptional regulator [Hoeflea marina]